MSELRVDNIVSQDGTAAPVYTKGVRVAAGQTMTVEGDLSVTGTTTIEGATEFSSGFEVSGIVTATSFSGTATTATTAGTATTATNLADAANITTGTINDARLPDLITSNLNIASGITTVGTAVVGTAVTITSDGIDATGIVTATSLDAAISEWTLGADSPNHYTFSGPGLTGAENDPSIHLVRGQKYRFKNSSGGHPFRIQSTPNGSAGSQYNDGVTNNDAGDGTTLEIDVQFDAPDLLYYQCTAHPAMGGRLYIGNSGSSIEISTSGVGTVTIASGIVSATGGYNIGINSASSVITTDPVKTLNFIGAGNTFAYNATTDTVDISIAGSGGGGGGGDGSDFNTGISSAIFAVATGIGSTVLTMPSTAGAKYIVYSIHAANVSTGNTEVNVIGRFDYNGGEETYFGYNIPIPTGTAVEMLKQPHILNPSDKILIRSTDYDRNGADDIVEVTINFEEKEDGSDYFGIGIGTVGVAVTTPVAIHTATTSPSILQSINLVNRTDSGAYPISVSITNGVVTTYLVQDLVVPKYAAVELLDEQKRMATNAELKVEADMTSMIDIQVSGKKATT